MSREQLECLVEAIENLILDESGIECPVETNENSVVEENRRSDPPCAHYIPHDVAQWFIEGVRRFQNGDVESLDRALGLVRAPGHPVDPNKKEFDLAKNGTARKLHGDTWTEINDELFADRKKPPDERYIRRLVTRYRVPVLASLLHDRWVSQSEERKQRQFLKNSRKGKPDSNSG